MLPSDLECTASHFRYVFPRAHAIEYMLMYARLAWVKMLDKTTDEVTTDIIASLFDKQYQDEILQGCSIIEAFMAPGKKNLYDELEFMERRILGNCERLWQRVRKMACR